MFSIKVLSNSPDAHDWMQNSRHPRILHVFDRACNLINERREILSIVTTHIGNGPFNLVIEDNIAFTNHIDTDSLIFLRVDQLSIGDITLNFANTETWFPQPDWGKLHAKRNDIFNQVGSLQEKTILFSNYQTPIFNHLIFSLANADLSNCVDSAKQLAGLGQGLTPAGDDFIIGAVLATRIIHPPEIARVIAEEITNATIPWTTSLSAAWLKSAGKGEAGIAWHILFDTLINSDAKSTQNAMDNILAIGETSGNDALSGFLGSLKCRMELASSQPRKTYTL